jgi:hypothetical protein
VEFSETERKLLRQGRLFRELDEVPAWKELLELVAVHIKTRVEMLDQPLHAWPTPEGAVVDYMTKVLQAEHIKGVVYGMRLVASLPSLTVQQAQGLAAERAAANDEATSQGDGEDAN